VATPAAAVALEDQQQQAGTQHPAKERLDWLYAQYPGQRPEPVQREITHLEKQVEDAAAAEAAAAENQAAAVPVAALDLPFHSALDRALKVLDHPTVSALPDDQKHKLIYYAADKCIGDILRGAGNSQHVARRDQHDRVQPYPGPPTGHRGARR
jgi:hypothetical protein